MEKLRDIKGIVEVVDYSMYYLVMLIFLVFAAIIAIIWFLRKPKKRKKPTNAQKALQNLKDIDYENSKDIAYTFSLNIPFFTNEKNSEEIKKILEKAEVYKYKKDIPDMDEEFKKSVKKIIERLK